MHNENGFKMTIICPMTIRCDTQKDKSNTDKKKTGEKQSMIDRF
jgi:hypothetical protein